MNAADLVASKQSAALKLDAADQAVANAIAVRDAAKEVDDALYAKIAAVVKDKAFFILYPNRDRADIYYPGMISGEEYRVQTISAAETIAVDEPAPPPGDNPFDTSQPIVPPWDDIPKVDD